MHDIGRWDTSVFYLFSVDLWKGLCLLTDEEIIQSICHNPQF